MPEHKKLRVAVIGCGMIHVEHMQGYAELKDKVEIVAAVDRKRECLEAVRTCCDSSGSGLYALDNPMQRILRDIEVMASHIVYDMDVSTELHGRSMVGLPPNSMLT